jgi:hypothetical protein
VKRAQRRARRLPLPQADAELVAVALKAASDALAHAEKAAPADVAVTAVIAPLLERLSDGARYMIRAAHIDDVVKTGLDLLPAAQKAVALASLAFSATAREEARQIARQVQQVCREYQAPAHA